MIMDEIVRQVAYKGKNIALIGMPGTFKSTVGRLLAKNLKDMEFVDTDALYEKVIGETIKETFATSGEAVFRKRETEVLSHAINTKRQVIATGGGIVLQEANRKLLKENCFVIQLHADPQTIYNRTRASGRRPLLANATPLSIYKLQLERKPYYDSVTKLHIITDNKHPRYITREILAKICDD